MRLLAPVGKYEASYVYGKKILNTAVAFDVALLEKLYIIKLT